MDNECKKVKIREALRLFIDKDKEELLKVDIYESTISHRIAVYLEGLFPDYDIDCEYNKNLLGDKKNVNGKKIRPDILIHKRLNNDANCVVIEIKKNGIKSKLAQADIKKLKDCMIGTLNYNLGVFVGVVKRKIQVCWIEKIYENFLESLETLKN